MDRDAQLNELIRLKQVPPAPIERWQILATRPVPTTTSTCVNGRSPARFCGPKTPNNVQYSQATCGKTPESNRLVIKYKKTPKLKGKGTPTKTPHGQSTKKRSPPKSGKRRTGHTPSGCRFIPNRSTTDLDYSSFLIQQSVRQSQKKKGRENQEGEEEETESPGKEEYRQTLLNALARNRSQPRQKGVLSFKAATPSTSGSLLNYTSDSLSTSKTNSSLRSSNRRSMKKTAHRIPTTADKILDAPGLIDDYYLNTLDWGKNNRVAIGLGPDVFLWNANNGSVHKLLELSQEGEYVCSVSWAGNGKYLAVGSNSSAIQLWDVEKEKRVRTMGGHTDRVGVLTWSKHTLTSGCRDGVIHHHDVRKAEHIVAQSQYHQLEVCGLKWSPDGSKLASGGNDNLVCIWNASNPSEPAQVLRGHQAAVKAIAWCPWHPNLLATGGGSSDKTIKFWNVYTQQCAESIDAKSQVSSLAWNREHKALISAHGAPRYQMSVWSYPSLTKVGELSGHQDRVLQMSLSPRKSTVCSAGADETLRFWNCFERTEHNASHKSYSEDSILALIHSAS